MQRLIFRGFETRLMIGISMFVAIMVLVGWIAINETARMASFEEQHLGRSIERGAELYAANCSTCHGTDALGLLERAPALNNPQLFGYSPFGEINSLIEPLERQLGDLAELEALLTEERDTLVNELGAGVDTTRQTEILNRVDEIDAQLSLTDDQQALIDERAALAEEAATAEADRLEEINTRLAEIDEALQTAAAEDGASIGIRQANLNLQLEPLYAERQALIDTLQPAIDNGYLVGIDAIRDDELALTQFLKFNTARLDQVNWEGDLESYITTTLIHGRPGSNNVWPQAMVSWSQRGGGPLRDDQIEDVTNYLLNYGTTNWTLDNFFQVQQYGKLLADAALAGEAIEADPVGTDVAAITNGLTTVTGDPVRGEALYAGSERTQLRVRLGCTSCHLNGAQAPDTVGTWDRVQNERLAEAQFADYTGEQYLVESIVHPGDYAVEGWNPVMPANYGEQMSLQDIADLIAYLKTQTESAGE